MTDLTREQWLKLAQKLKDKYPELSVEQHIDRIREEEPLTNHDDILTLWGCLHSLSHRTLEEVLSDRAKALETIQNLISNAGAL